MKANQKELKSLRNMLSLTSLTPPTCDSPATYKFANNRTFAGSPITTQIKQEDKMTTQPKTENLRRDLETPHARQLEFLSETLLQGLHGAGLSQGSRTSIPLA